MSKYSMHLPHPNRNWHIKNTSDLAFVDIRQARLANFKSYLKGLFGTREIVSLSGSATMIIAEDAELTELCLLNFDKIPLDDNASLLTVILRKIELDEVEAIFLAFEFDSFKVRLTACGISTLAAIALWKNKWIIENILAQAASDANLKEYAEAKNRLTEMEIRTQFADARQRRSIASLKQLPLDLMEKLIADGNDHEKIMLARNPSLTPGMFEVLAKDPGVEVRRNLANNPFLPATLFSGLAHDPRAEVRGVIASRMDTPRNLLEYLANDKQSLRVAYAAESIINGLVRSQRSA